MKRHQKKGVNQEEKLRQNRTVFPSRRNHCEKTWKVQIYDAVNTDEHRKSTKSLAGSILEQYFENGRRYGSENYFMPNDDEEQTRLAIAHQAYLLILGGQLTLAHVPRDVRRILDIGTGTGDWAMAMGELFPEAQITATDIAAYQSDNVPPNVSFEVDNATEDWTYNEAFDFIHIRGLVGAFRDWPAVYSRVCKHLRPGGCFEIADFGAIKLEGNAPDAVCHTLHFNKACQSAAKKAGNPLGLDHLNKTVLEKVGLNVVKSKTFHIPLGTWSADPRKVAAGKMALICTLEGLEAMSLRLLTNELAWKVEDVRDLCEKVKAELMRDDIKATVPCQFVVARKML